MMSDNQVEPNDTIVVGVDGSDTSIAALHWACEQAARTGSSIAAITTWHWPMSLGAAIPIPEGYDPAGDAQAMLDRIVEPLAGEFPSVAIRSRTAKGHAPEALVEASRHADLLVVGSRGHGELSGLLIGSVSQYCAAHAESPVLIYRDRPARH
jgi:nucleotide-binding universal stress UspA family protein